MKLGQETLDDLGLDETQEPFLVLGAQNICRGRWAESCHSCMAKPNVSSSFPLDVILAFSQLSMLTAPLKAVHMLQYALLLALSISLSLAVMWQGCQHLMFVDSVRH